MTQLSLSKARLAGQSKCPSGYQTVLRVSSTGTRIAVVSTKPPSRTGKSPVIVFDAGLGKLADFRVKARLHGVDVSPDGSQIALATDRSTAMYTIAGKRVAEFPHMPCDRTFLNGCSYSRDGRLLWTLHPGRPPRIVVIDVERQSILASCEIEFETEPDRGVGSEFLLHPGDGIVIAHIYSSESNAHVQCEFDAKVRAERMPTLDEHCLLGFSPSGRIFIASDFESDGFVGRYQFPSCKVLEKIQPTGRWYGNSAAMLNEEQALFLSLDDRLLIVDVGTFQPVAEVLPEGFELPHPWWTYEADEVDPWEEIRSIRILSATKWVSTHVNGRIKLWNTGDVSD